MNTRALTRTIALLAALACASHARAQGDLDILLRTVPPVVIIQFDTSGSMRNIVLPNKYITDRGAGQPTNWFNSPTNGTGTPVRKAAQVVNAASPLNYNAAGGGALGGGNENYQRTCQIFNNTTNTNTSAALWCAPGSPANSGTCMDDNQDASSPLGGSSGTGHVVIRCWEMPSAVSGSCPPGVPVDIYTGVGGANGGACTTVMRSRQRGATVGSTTTFTSKPYTTITLPDVSYTSVTEYPVNYIWWMLNEIYLGNTPVSFIAQDRNLAAKTAVKALINQMNVTGQDDKVWFGIARYDGAASNGGYIVVPPAAGNKATLLSTIGDLTSGLDANGSTPLSETLVDVGRYIAGADKLGTYPAYNRNLTGGTGGAVPASPITSQCQKIFAIVVTDGLPTSDANNHYGTNFTTTVGPTVALGGFIDGDGDFTDDVAAKLFATDLRPSIPGIQNIVTYTVGFSLSSTLLQHAATRGDGTYYSSNDATELGNSLFAAVTDILLRNATLTAANVPASRSAFGDGFYTAWFKPGGRRSEWPGHLQAFTVNASLVVMDKNNQPAIDPLTDLFYEPRSPYWDLADTLISDFASRTIYTTKAAARAPFTTAGITATDLGVSISEEMDYPQTPNNPDFTTSEELADAIVNWVHGKDAFDEDHDGSLTEVRPFVLGDIFHSNPLAVGPPLPFLRFETGYGPASLTSSFMATYAHRDRVMYVGANDGMLHGVAAGKFVDPDPAVTGDESYSSGTGKELFGYVPAGVLSRIKLLPRLDTGKQYFVDGASAAADVWIDYNLNGVKDGSDWTTTLLTPLREGGESVLALDVTDPAATAGNHGPYPRFMWEFTDAGLAETWSKPIITRLKLRAGLGVGDKCGANNGDGDCIEQWVAIFGAGYRVQGDPNMSLYTNDPNNASYTTKGRGVYIVRINDGTILAHLSQDPNSATFSKMKYAIPAEPAVLDLNFDGFADVVYVGDLGGQLWKWDLSAVGVPTAGVVPTSIWPAGVVFEAPVATVAAGLKHYHSIFQSAAAAFDSRVLTLSFASGERANLGYKGEADPNDPNSLVGKYDDNNRFWVLKDKKPTGAGAFPTTEPIYEEPLSPATVPLPGHGKLTDMTTSATDPNTTDEGYFFRVKDGEKFMTNHLIFGGHVVTVSYTPDSLNTIPTGTCALGGKTNEWAWQLNNGAAALDDPININQMVRTRTLGNGAATDPRISVSKDSTGKIVVRITSQTSMGEVTNPDGGGLTLDPVDMIYWRQNF